MTKTRSLKNTILLVVKSCWSLPMKKMRNLKNTILLAFKSYLSLRTKKMKSNNLKRTLIIIKRKKRKEVHVRRALQSLIWTGITSVHTTFTKYVPPSSRQRHPSCVPLHPHLKDEHLITKNLKVRGR